MNQFQEYPKCLIRGDEYRIAKDAEQEAEARRDGFCFHDDPPDAAPEAKKRGRPRKVIE